MVVEKTYLADKQMQIDTNTKVSDIKNLLESGVDLNHNLKFFGFNGSISSGRSENIVNLTGKGILRNISIYSNSNDVKFLIVADGVNKLDNTLLEIGLNTGETHRFAFNIPFDNQIQITINSIGDTTRIAHCHAQIELL